jgi:hypothetical protein
MIHYKQFIIICSLLFGLVHFSCVKKEGKTLKVVYHEQFITIDGEITNNEWEMKSLISGLVDPWSEKRVDQTEFKAFHSKHHFYFCFEVFDTTITTFDFKGELTVAEEDRVELFFCPDTSLRQYFCVEIDPLGRVLDYSAQFYRKFDEQWKLEQMEIAANICDSGYVVEGRFPLDEMKKLGIGDNFWIGIFRADFKRSGDITWYSWISPKSIEPDFHIPSAFEKISLK